MSKANLLLTMGCSFTEGMGCYDEMLVKKYKVKEGDGTTYTWPLNFELLYLNSFDNFHKFGWPNNIGKLLGYDEVINMGYSGSSTSGQVKILTEKYLNDTLNEYNVDIIWMLTDPNRFSFYIDKKIYDFHPTKESLLESSYLKTIKDETDSLLEQKFYIKLIEEICSKRNWNLLITHWSHHYFKQIKEIYKSKNYIKSMPEESVLTKPSLKSSICGHPNQLGYEYISKQMLKVILLHHKEFVKGEYNKNIKWTWTGPPRVNIMDNII